MNESKAPGCESCGMPLRSDEDRAPGPDAARFCRHCTDEHGRLRTYEEVKAGMSAFLVRTQGLDPGSAGAMAGRMLDARPLWAGRR